MTQIIAKRLIDEEKVTGIKRMGSIINIGSIAGFNAGKDVEQLLCPLDAKIK